MAFVRKKKERKVEQGVATWLTSFADMTNLIVCFWVALYALSQESIKQNEAIIGVAFQGFGSQSGGATMQPGQMLDLGNNIMSFPSTERGKSLARAKKTALSVFQYEVKTRKVRVAEEERGLVISLSAELFFAPGSADINMEEANGVLRRVANLLQDDDLKQKNRKFRIEGHTDNIAMDPGSKYDTNWELSTARATNILHYLVQLGVDEKQMSVAGYADNRPVAENVNRTEEDRAVNRRVDIVILTEGHL